jgi:hypothetical protein
MPLQSQVGEDEPPASLEGLVRYYFVSFCMVWTVGLIWLLTELTAGLLA